MSKPNEQKEVELIISNSLTNDSIEWEEHSLIDVRCPRKRYFERYKTMAVCNYKCAEAFAGASGRAYCSRCRPTSDGLFWYKIDADYVKPKPTRIVNVK